MTPEKKRRAAAAGRALRAAASAAGAVCIFLGVMPMAFMVFNTGAAALIAYGGATIALCVLWDRFDGWGRVPRRIREVSDLRHAPAPLWWRRTRIIAAACLIAAAAGGAGLSAAMNAAIANPPQGPATAVVLGCKVYGDKPSLMLQRRLTEALAYLQANPDAPVVCSGGKTKGDPYSEAEVMAMYLTDSGIAPERIYLDNTSGTTGQNMANAAAIIRENGLPEQAAVATDGFHELRAWIYAKKNGLTGRALPAVTPWGIAPSYWVREWFGLAKSLFF